MDTVVGIDFGSSLCRTAVCRQGEVEAFGNRFSERALPVSLAAVEAAPLPVTISGIKEKLGSAEQVTLGDRRLAASDAAAEIFRDLAEDAREFSRGDADGVVVGVPACFLERQRAALQEAAERGGFRRVRLLDESVAVLLAPEVPRRDQTALVYALGAGGFCASVVRVERGAVRELCHEGQPGLGGHLFTAVVMAAILERLPLAPAQLSGAPEALSRLRARAEQVKLGLSKRPLVEFDVDLRELFPPDLIPGGGGSLSTSLSREEFEARIAAYLDATVGLTQAAVRGAGVQGGQIDTVLLVGGSTRIPLVERRLREEFQAPFQRAPESAVASGLAWFGAQLPEAEWQSAQPAAQPAPPQPEASAAPPPPLEAARAADESWAAQFAPSFQEAQVAWFEGDLDRAVARFERILRQEIPQFLGHLYYRQGKTLLEAGRHDEAIRTLERALQYDHQDQAIRRALAQAYQRQGRARTQAKQYDAAVVSLGRAQSLEPRTENLRADFHHVFSSKARDLYAAGRFLEARATLQQAFQIEPRCPRCLAFQDVLEAHLRGGRRGDSRRKKRDR